MSYLAIIPPIAVPACLADAEIAAALGYAEQEKSAGTRKAYQSDFRIFTVFCLSRGLVAMPATASTVARFLSSQADGGLKASTDRTARRRGRLRPQAGRLRASHRCRDGQGRGPRHSAHHRCCAGQEGRSDGGRGDADAQPLP